ncbi:EndoU domain-containing protein, partial [Azoarcus indigens]
KLAWLKEMESRGDIDWQRVKEVHDQWKYSHSGMGAGLAIIVAIVIAIVTYGAASEAIGAAATTTTTTAAGAGAAAGTASTASAWAVGGWANAAASASLAGMASNTAVQLGTTGKVDWGQVLKTGAVSAITAGVSNYGFFEGGQSLNSLAGLSAAPGAAGSTTATSGLSFSWDQLYGVMGRGVVNAGVSSAIQGSDFKDGFINSVVGDYAALGANSIGSLWGNGQNPVMQTLAHAALGAGAAGLTGRDAVAGAIGGLVESGLDNTLGQSLRESGTELGKWDKLAYMVAAMVAGGVVAEAAGHDGVTATQTAQNAALNNFLNTTDKARRDELRAKGGARTEAENRELATLEVWDQLSDEYLWKQQNGIELTEQQQRNLNFFVSRYGDGHVPMPSNVATEAQAVLLETPVQWSPTKNYQYAGSSDAQIAYMDENHPLTALASWLPGSGRTETANEVQFDNALRNGGFPIQVASGLKNDWLLPSNQSVLGLATWLDQYSPVYNSATGGALYALGNLLGASEGTSLILAGAGQVIESAGMGWGAGGAAKPIFPSAPGRYQPAPAYVTGTKGSPSTPSQGAKATGKDYVDILSPEAKKHILYGDKPGSGGHMWPGQPGKTAFPQSWSADKIVHEVGDIATSPNTKWYAQTGTGGAYTSKGDPAKWVAYEVRDGVRMRVVYQPATGKVITAFPDNAPIPPYKPIK